MKTRTWKLHVGEHDFSQLDFAFDCRKTVKKEPNTCDIAIYGLGDDIRAALATAQATNVKLEAGHDGDNALLYLGQVRSASSKLDGAGWVTKIESGDSEAQHRKQIVIPVGAQTDAGTVLRAIARTLGVGEGNVDTVAAQLKGRGLTLHGTSTILSDTAEAILTDFCRSAGLDWSIQDGRLQITDLNKALEQTAISLDSDTGLIGSPTVDYKGVLEATALIMPGLLPGRKVYFKTPEVKGLFRLTDVNYKGATYQTDWYANMHGKRLKY